jgi:class 3 adenylate cyclase
MRRYRALFRPPGAFCAGQSWADCITNTAGSDFRQGQVDALRCAIEVQRGMADRNAAVPQDKRIEFRVGIHQGDIILDGDDIFGDGVNVAARLEGLAEPGGLCVSARVQEDARGKLASA